MAQLKIAGNVKIGHIYECELGLFKRRQPAAGEPLATSDKNDAVDDDYNYAIPNELVKKRLVVVIGKHKGQYIIVPISSTKETHRQEHKEPEKRGFHILLSAGDMPVTTRYIAGRARWAKSNLVMTVDGGRLRDIYDPSVRRCIAAHAVTEATLARIRYGVMISIGLGSLVPEIGDAEQANN